LVRNILWRLKGQGRADVSLILVSLPSKNHFEVAPSFLR